LLIPFVNIIITIVICLARTPAGPIDGSEVAATRHTNYL